MLNECGLYTDTVDNLDKNDQVRKNIGSEGNYYTNGPEISATRTSNLSVPSASWNYNPYLGNFYNYYANNSYDLTDLHQYDSQKYNTPFTRNYGQHTIQSASVLQCCDPRCQLLSEHSKYPFNDPLSNKYNQKIKRPKNYYGGIIDTQKQVIIKSCDHNGKYASSPSYSSFQDDINTKYRTQQQNFNSVYQNTIKSSKDILLPSESTAFTDYYTDIGKPSYWNKQNIWNRNISNSYYSSFEHEKVNQKILPSTVHEQNNVTSGNQRGILFNRLLDHRNRYDTSYMPNYHYGKQNHGYKNSPNYSSAQIYSDTGHIFTDDTSNNRLSLQNNSYQSLPIYDFHYSLENKSVQSNSCIKEDSSKNISKSIESKQNRILDKNPNLDVREFLSTWDDVEDDKLPENINESTPVIVLDCTSLEGDALAKVKEKFGKNITDCNALENNATTICEQFSSHSGNATVLKVVDDNNDTIPESPHTSVIQESYINNSATFPQLNRQSSTYNLKSTDVCDIEKPAIESSHLNSDVWYSSNSKKKDDFSYDLVEMTERLVNTVDKLFSESDKLETSNEKSNAASFHETKNNTKEDVQNRNILSEDEWNIHFNYRRNKNVDKESQNEISHTLNTNEASRYNQFAKEDIFSNCAATDSGPLNKIHSTITNTINNEQHEPVNNQKNVSCSFNFQKTNNDLTFSMNYSKQATEYYVSKVQDCSVKYKNNNFNEEPRNDFYSKYKIPENINQSENCMYKNYSNFNSYYYNNNTNCDYSLQTDMPPKHDAINYAEIDKDIGNDSVSDMTNLTLVKADLEKSLKEITHQFSCQNEKTDADKHEIDSDLKSDKISHMYDYQNQSDYLNEKDSLKIDRMKSIVVVETNAVLFKNRIEDNVHAKHSDVPAYNSVIQKTGVCIEKTSKCYKTEDKLDDCISLSNENNLLSMPSLSPSLSPCLNSSMKSKILLNESTNKSVVACTSPEKKSICEVSLTLNNVYEDDVIFDTDHINNTKINSQQSNVDECTESQNCIKLNAIKEKINSDNDFDDDINDLNGDNLAYQPLNLALSKDDKNSNNVQTSVLKLCTNNKEKCHSEFSVKNIGSIKTNCLTDSISDDQQENNCNEILEPDNYHAESSSECNSTKFNFYNKRNNYSKKFEKNVALLVDNVKCNFSNNEEINTEHTSEIKLHLTDVPHNAFEVNNFMNPLPFTHKTCIVSREQYKNKIEQEAVVYQENNNHKSQLENNEKILLEAEETLSTSSVSVYKSIPDIQDYNQVGNNIMNITDRTNVYQNVPDSTNGHLLNETLSVDCFKVETSNLSLTNQNLKLKDNNTKYIETDKKDESVKIPILNLEKNNRPTCNDTTEAQLYSKKSLFSLKTISDNIKQNIDIENQLNFSNSNHGQTQSYITKQVSYNNEEFKNQYTNLILNTRYDETIFNSGTTKMSKNLNECKNKSTELVNTGKIVKIVKKIKRRHKKKYKKINAQYSLSDRNSGSQKVNKNEMVLNLKILDKNIGEKVEQTQYKHNNGLSNSVICDTTVIKENKNYMLYKNIQGEKKYDDIKCNEFSFNSENMQCDETVNKICQNIKNIKCDSPNNILCKCNSNKKFTVQDKEENIENSFPLSNGYHDNIYNNLKKYSNMLENEYAEQNKDVQIHIEQHNVDNKLTESENFSFQFENTRLKKHKFMNSAFVKDADLPVKKRKKELENITSRKINEFSIASKFTKNQDAEHPEKLKNWENTTEKSNIAIISDQFQNDTRYDSTNYYYNNYLKQLSFENKGSKLKFLSNENRSRNENLKTEDSLNSNTKYKKKHKKDKSKSFRKSFKKIKRRYSLNEMQNYNSDDGKLFKKIKVGFDEPKRSESLDQLLLDNNDERPQEFKSYGIMVDLKGGNTYKNFFNSKTKSVRNNCKLIKLEKPETMPAENATCQQNGTWLENSDLLFVSSQDNKNKKLEKGAMKEDKNIKNNSLVLNELNSPFLEYEVTVSQNVDNDISSVYKYNNKSKKDEFEITKDLLQATIDDEILSIPSIAPTPNCDLGKEENADQETPSSPLCDENLLKINPVECEKENQDEVQSFIYNAPSPNCDLIKNDSFKEVEEEAIVALNVGKCSDDGTDVVDFTCKAPSPNCILNEENSCINGSKAPSPCCVFQHALIPDNVSSNIILENCFNKSQNIDDNNETFESSYSDANSVFSVAPSPNCDIIDGVLLEDTDCQNNSNKALFSFSVTNKSSSFIINNIPNIFDEIQNEKEDVNNILFFKEIPSLKSLAMKTVSKMHFDSICTSNNNNLLEVRVTPKKTEIIIHSKESASNQTDFVFSNNKNGSLLVTNALYKDEEISVTPYFDNIKEISFNYSMGLESIVNEISVTDDNDLQCQCLIISSEESIVCLHCSLNSSIIVNQDSNNQLGTDYKAVNEKSYFENNINCETVDEHYENLFVTDNCIEANNCIEESFIDQKINFSPDWSNNENINQEYAYSLVSNKVSECFSNESNETKEIQNVLNEENLNFILNSKFDNSQKFKEKFVPNFQMKVKLPWHKIFNLSERDSVSCDKQRQIELGPAKIEIRLSSDDSRSWKAINSKNKCSSPVLKVRRLILQKATHLINNKNCLSENSDIDECTQSSFVSGDCLTQVSVALEQNKSSVNKLEKYKESKEVHRLPKMVIKKTSCQEYKSYLQTNNLMQPVVRLFRSKSLDLLALKLCKDNPTDFSINLREFRRSSSADYERNSGQEIENRNVSSNNKSPIMVKFSLKASNNKPNEILNEAISQETSEKLFPKQELHHCLLCHRSYSSEELYQLHVMGRFHRHLELTQRKTIHAMYRYFTGHICPRLRPLSIKERKKMKWKPRNDNVNHFYHKKTPLQVALHRPVSENEFLKNQHCN